MNYIVFVWDNITYSVERTTDDPIILPNGEIVLVKFWDKRDNPIRGCNLIYVANIKIFDETDLASVALQIHGLLASAISLEVTHECPHNCLNPTVPFCNQCGSKVETHIKVSELPFTPRSLHDEEMDMPRNHHCPRCDKSLVYDLDHCPQCNQPLRVTGD